MYLLLRFQPSAHIYSFVSTFSPEVIALHIRTHTKGSHWTPKWQHLFSFHVSCWRWVFSLHMSPCGIWQGWHLSILDYTVAKSLHNHCRKIWFKSQCKKYPLLCDVGHVYAGRPTLDCLFSLVGTYAMEYSNSHWCQHIQFMLTIHLVDILSLLNMQRLGHASKRQQRKPEEPTLPRMSLHIINNLLMECA